MKKDINKWEIYHNDTKDDPPHKNVINFVEKNVTIGNAIDIGCGSGRDTIYLIKNNWKVLAIDFLDVEEKIRTKLSNEEQKLLEFEIQNLEELKLKKCDLIIANYSLPFCKREAFSKMWKEICLNIKENGYFVGNFFGINDGWNKPNDKRIFFSKEEVEGLFEEFKIIEFKEIEKDKKTARGIMKHWHIFEVVAQKIR